MDDVRIQQIVDDLGDNPCPVVMLTALSDVVDEVDNNWRQRIKALLNSPELTGEAKELIASTFPEAVWVDGEPEDYVRNADEPAVLPLEMQQ